MLIEYVNTRTRRLVSDEAGNRLVAAKIARPVDEQVEKPARRHADPAPDSDPAPSVVDDDDDVDAEIIAKGPRYKAKVEDVAGDDDDGAAPRKRRRYKRRDMRAED